MAKMFDTSLSGILGTAGTTELLLGSNGTGAGQALTVPDKAKSLLEAIPFQSGNAVVTASESITTRIRIDSDDTNLVPKIFIMPEILGGLGATTAHLIPMLMAFPINAPLKGLERINYRAQPMVANTTATVVEVGVVYSDGGPQGPEQYYQSTANTTLTAPAANARTAGANVTITQGRQINLFHPHISSVVQTAAQAYIGRAEFQSNDFEGNVQGPYRMPTQPVGGFLGATNSPFDINGDVYKLGNDGPRIKNSGQAVIETFWTNRVLQTGNVNFNSTFGFLK